MNKTTHFQLNDPVGSDKVNLLTDYGPNWDKIDTALYNGQQAAVQGATESKSGVTHAIVRKIADSPIFRFTATSTFDAGDSVTVDGQPVTAVLPDGSILPGNAFQASSQVLCILDAGRLTVYTNAGTGTAKDSDKLGGKLPDYYAPAADAVQVYQHSKIGKVNNFIGTGANGRVEITARIELGDTVQVNGKPVEAYAGAADFVTTVAGQDLVGKWLTFVNAGGALNFKSAGGGKVTTTGLEADNIVSGETVTVSQSGRVVESVTGSHLPRVIFPFANFGPIRNTETRTFNAPGGDYIMVYTSYTKNSGNAKLIVNSGEPLLLPSGSSPITPAIPGLSDNSGTFTATSDVFTIPDGATCKISLSTNKDTGNSVYLIKA